MPAEAFADFGVESDPRSGAGDPEPAPAPPPPLGGDEPEKEVGRFGFLRGGMTLVWIVLAALYSILRACGEG